MAQPANKATQQAAMTISAPAMTAGGNRPTGRPPTLPSPFVDMKRIVSRSWSAVMIIARACVHASRLFVPGGGLTIFSFKRCEVFRHVRAAHRPTIPESGPGGDRRRTSRLQGTHQAALFSSILIMVAVLSVFVSSGCRFQAEDDPEAVALWSAARWGQQRELESALAKGLDVDAHDDLGKTAMHWAAQYGHDEVAKTLLAHGAEVDAKSKTGYTPLHLAAGRVYGTTVKMLLEHQADVNAREDNGWTPLHRIAAADEGDMRFRTEEEHLNLVRLLLDQGADLHARDRSGFTPLHYATVNRHLAAMTLLLNRGADVNAQADSTPLIIAVRGGNKEAVELLLSRGADVDA